MSASVRKSEAVMVGLFRLPLLGRWLADKVRRLGQNVQGFAAVEFAMIVPVLIVMLMGAVETSDALTVSGRMINISGSIADMTARCTTLTNGDLNDMMSISASLLGHYSPQSLYIRVVDVQADANDNLTVAWSYDSNHASPVAAGSSFSGVSPGLVPVNGQLVIATSSYNYSSPMGHFIHGRVKLTHTSYNSPRLGNISLSNGVAVTTGGC
jgi:Flp pilus assembly protein TadG